MQRRNLFAVVIRNKLHDIANVAVQCSAYLLQNLKCYIFILAKLRQCTGADTTETAQFYTLHPQVNQALPKFVVTDVQSSHPIRFKVYKIAQPNIACQIIFAKEKFAIANYKCYLSTF
mgnify:CR=1 FL=1